MFSWLKGLLSVLSLLNKLSDWWHDRNIRLEERKRIEKEAQDELTKDMAIAEHVRDDIANNPDSRDRVRKQFTRKE